MPATFSKNLNPADAKNIARRTFFSKDLNSSTPTNDAPQTSKTREPGYVESGEARGRTPLEDEVIMGVEEDEDEVEEMPDTAAPKENALAEPTGAYSPPDSVMATDDADQDANASRGRVTTKRRDEAQKKTAAESAARTGRRSEETASRPRHSSPSRRPVDNAAPPKRPQSDNRKSNRNDFFTNDTDLYLPQCNCKEYATCIDSKCRCKPGYVDISPPSVPGSLCKSVTQDGCESGWGTVDGSKRCFKVLQRQPVTFEEAVDACRQEAGNSTLASVGTEVEVAYLGTILPTLIEKKSSHKKVWIGLHRKNQDTPWEWITENGEGQESTFSAFLDNRFLKDPEASSKLCVYAVGSRYGKGRWMKANCSDTSVVGFICSKDRKGEYVSEEDLVYRQFMITCCQGGTPTLDDDLLDIVRGWTATNTGFVGQCKTYEGVYQIPKSVYDGTSFRQVSVNCKCTGEHRDRNCRDARICENSGYRAASENHRCVCVGRYFGEVCEKYCFNGRLKKNALKRDYCECQARFSGETCNDIQCEHGAELSPEFGSYRACVCEEGYEGRFCDKARDTGGRGAEEHANSGTNLQQALGTTAPTLFFFIVLMALYCLCKRMRYCARLRDRMIYGTENPHDMASIGPNGHRVQSQQLSSLPTMTGADVPPPFANHAAYPFPSHANMGLPPGLPPTFKPPPSYEDIFGADAATGSRPAEAGGHDNPAMSHHSENDGDNDASRMSAASTEPLASTSESNTNAQSRNAQTVDPVAREDGNSSTETHFGLEQNATHTGNNISSGRASNSLTA